MLYFTLGTCHDKLFLQNSNAYRGITAHSLFFPILNYEHNKELMEKCTELRDYALLISRIRSNCKNGLLLGDAIDKAIDDCIKEGVLKDILEAHRMEAKEMLFTEYNEEAHINHVKKSSFENGMDIMGELFIKLENQNRLSDYSKAAKDPQFRDKLLKEIFPESGV